LTSYEATIITNSSNYNFTFYTDAGLTNQISTPTAFDVNTATTTVYAKVCDKAHPTACSPADITLTVKEKPVAPVLSKVDNCNGTTTITAKDGSNVTFLLVN